MYPSSRFVRRRRLGPCLAFLAAALVAACGPSETTTPTTPSSGPEATAASGSSSSDPGAGAPAGGPPSRVDVCHLDEETGQWELLSLPEPAADNHLAHHDDAPPGGTTPSGTSLDDSCVPVPEECPCYDTLDVVALFEPGEPDRSLTCSADSFSAFIHDLDESYGPWLVESLERFDDSTGEAFWTCEQTLLGGSSPDELRMEITEEEHLACVDVIAAAQVELGCS